METIGICQTSRVWQSASGLKVRLCLICTQDFAIYTGASTKCNLFFTTVHHWLILILVKAGIRFNITSSMHMPPYVITPPEQLFSSVPPSTPLITGGGTISESASVTITCESTGLPAPRIIWLKKNGTELRDLSLFTSIRRSRITIETSAPTVWDSCEVLSSSSLTIDSVTAEDNGMYVCEVENGLPPNQMNSTNISVIGKLSIFKAKLLCSSSNFVVCSWVAWVSFWIAWIK